MHQQLVTLFSLFHAQPELSTLIENSGIGKSMKNTETYLPDVECSEVILVENANELANREVTTNKAALHNTLLPTQRNIPNILRNSNIKTQKSYEIFSTDKMDTYFLLNAEHASTTQVEVTGAAVSSIGPAEKEVIYNKIASPKSHHQRKQVHNPLNLQYDALDWNNNKKLLGQVDGVSSLRLPPDQDENTSTKKLRRQKAKKHAPHGRKRMKKMTKARKTCETTGNEMGSSNGKPDFHLKRVGIQDANVNDKVVVQNVDHFRDNDTTVRSICGSNVASSCANANYANKDDIGGRSEVLFNISCCNNEACDFKGTHNCNPVVSDRDSTEFNSARQQTLQDRFTSNESFVINDLEASLESRGTMDGDIASSYLMKPKALHTCTCMNCTSCDKDIIFNEEPVSTSTNSDNSEAELYTSHLCDFYSDYSHLFDENWLKDFDNENLSSYCEEIEETNITRDNAHTSCDSATAEVIEDDANVCPHAGQSESQDAQPCRVDKMQDIVPETNPAELVAPSNGTERSSKLTQDMKDETNCANLENAPVKESKAAASQNEASGQNAVSASISVPKSKREQQKKKQGKKIFPKNIFHQPYFLSCENVTINMYV